MKKVLLISLLCISSFLSFSQQKENITVHFDFDKYDLSGAATQQLNDFLDKIEKQDIISLEINGYTDSKGSNAYNDALALKRANAVKDYLSAKRTFNNISVNVKGFGEDKLLNTDATDAESRENRRVEIIAAIKEIPVIKVEKTLSTMMQDTALKAGAAITLPNLLFMNNSDVLIASSLPTLEELKTILDKNPTLKISIEGHICCVAPVPGTPYEKWPNYKISVLRAKMVYDYLIKNGIAPARIIGYQGFGSSRPLYPIPEKTEQESIANRRVEIRIVEK